MKMLSKIVLSAALTVLAIAGALAWGNAHADEGFKGQTYKQGIVCTNPYVAKDLIDVIHDKTIFVGWERAYIETGYCQEWNGGTLTLKVNLQQQNKSFDGYAAELWAVEVEWDEGATKVMYAIVFPDAPITKAGAGI